MFSFLISLFPPQPKQANKHTNQKGTYSSLNNAPGLRNSLITNQHPLSYYQ